MYGDCDCISLITSTPSRCDFLHCGIEPTTEARADEMAAFAKSHTWDEYMIRYHGYTAEDVKDFNELDKTWNFEKN